MLTTAPLLATDPMTPAVSGILICFPLSVAPDHKSCRLSSTTKKVHLSAPPSSCARREIVNMKELELKSPERALRRSRSAFALRSFSMSEATTSQLRRQIPASAERCDATVLSRAVKTAPSGSLLTAWRTATVFPALSIAGTTSMLRVLYPDLASCELSKRSLVYASSITIVTPFCATCPATPRPFGMRSGAIPTAVFTSSSPVLWSTLKSVARSTDSSSSVSEMIASVAFSGFSSADMRLKLSTNESVSPGAWIALKLSLRLPLPSTRRFPSLSVFIFGGGMPAGSPAAGSGEAAASGTLAPHPIPDPHWTRARCALPLGCQKQT
mmetsp:Transcript_27711/g.90653  ORF Transcript_27711/g.90653 Transcript_27711/m.90653 type:complete len:326 (+) Transcript_27711:783-1760(+)